MKKLSYLLGLLLMAGLVFTSCSKDDDEEPQDLTPAITFQTGGDFINSDVTNFLSKLFIVSAASRRSPFNVLPGI